MCILYMQTYNFNNPKTQRLICVYSLRHDIVGRAFLRKIVENNHSAQAGSQTRWIMFMFHSDLETVKSVSVFMWMCVYRYKLKLVRHPLPDISLWKPSRPCHCWLKQQGQTGASFQPDKSVSLKGKAKKKEEVWVSQEVLLLRGVISSGLSR